MGVPVVPSNLETRAGCIQCLGLICDIEVIGRVESETSTKAAPRIISLLPLKDQGGAPSDDMGIGSSGSTLIGRHRHSAQRIYDEGACVSHPSCQRRSGSPPCPQYRSQPRCCPGRCQMNRSNPYRPQKNAAVHVIDRDKV